MVAVKLNVRVSPEGEGRVAGVPEVVAKVLLDHVALVTKAKHEVLEAVRSVDLHDVPEDRPIADRNHRLGTKLRLLAKPGAFAAAENDHLHDWVASIEDFISRARDRACGH